MNGKNSNWWFYNKNDNTCNWENLHKDKNYGGWTYSGNKNKKPFESLPTNDEMKASILSRTDEEGLFSDIIEWLEKMAPRKVRVFLKSLCHSAVRLTYDDFCEAIYKMGFRASEMLEKRMILGPTNKWVQDYFKDFPFA